MSWIQAGHAMLLESLLPTGNGWTRRVQLDLDLTPTLAVSQRQHQSGAENITGRQGSRLRPADQFFPSLLLEIGHSMIASHIPSTMQNINW
jgi:hypothetical protein